MLETNSPNNGHTPKLRAACENCRQSKVKCNLSGKNTCVRCLRHGLHCRYGYANRSGKPKGSKNRATLRKMGQLAEASWGVRTQEFIVDQKCLDQPLSMNWGDMGSESSGGLSESPRSFQDAVTADTPVTMDLSSLGSMLPFPGPPGLGYPNSSTSPTFPPKESKETDFPLAIHIPYPLQPECECVAIQLYHMNQLTRLATDAIVQLRLDQSLQTIKTSLSACRNFLQCPTCQKDSASVLLSVSILDLTLQHFEHWIVYERKSESSVGVRYGEYEADDGGRRIGNSLLRDLLLQCRGVLGMLKVSTNRPDDSSPGYLSPDAFSEGNCFHQIILAHEGTVEGYLRALVIE